MEPEAVGAAIGVVGTLLGGVLGLAGSALIESRSRRHADRTRFHDRRLEVFADLIATGIELSVRGGRASDKKEYQGAIDAVHEARRIMAQARMLGDEDVRDAVGQIQILIFASLSDADEGASADTLETRRREIIDAIGRFEAAANQCLGLAAPGS